MIRSGGSPVTIGVALAYITLWSSAFIATKVGVTNSPPLTLLVARFLTAAAIMAGIAAWRGLPAPRGARAWVHLALFGSLNSGLALAFTYQALQQLSAGMGSIITASNPLLLALVAPWLLGEALTRRKALGMILGFAGVVFVMEARLAGARHLDTPRGMALSFMHVVTLVVATILYKRIAPREDPLVVNAVQLGAGGLALVLPALVLERGASIRFNTPLIFSFFYLVFAISIGASLLWFWLLRRGEASVVSSYYFLTPIFGLLFAALLLGEPLGPRDAIGLVAVAGGIALIAR